MFFDSDKIEQQLKIFFLTFSKLLLFFIVMLSPFVLISIILIFTSGFNEQFINWVLFSMVLSIITEGFLFYKLLENISFVRAFGMAFTGKFISWLVGIPLGWILLGFFMRAYYAFAYGEPDIVFAVISLILIFSLFVLLELGILKVFCNYTFKQLLAPVFIGTLITFLLVALYAHYSPDISSHIRFH